MMIVRLYPLPRPGPVSYTHLIAFTGTIPVPGKKAVIIIVLISGTKVNMAVYSMPVSYTHLDVYKRQVLQQLTKLYFSLSFFKSL